MCIYKQKYNFRKDLIKFITYAKSAGILDIYMSTNGSLLTKKISKEIINSGLTRLQISLDAATKEIFDIIRVGGNFDKVISNVNRFMKIREELKSELPTVRVNFVQTDTNKHELNSFKEYSVFQILSNSESSSFNFDGLSNSDLS